MVIDLSDPTRDPDVFEQDCMLYEIRVGCSASQSVISTSPTSLPGWAGAMATLPRIDNRCEHLKASRVK